jgi:hypothetical protein
MDKLTPIYDPETNTVSETLAIVEKGIKSILRRDPFAEYRKAAEWGFANGLLRVKSESEINLELRSKPWLAINRLIKENEIINATNSSDSN